MIAAAAGPGQQPTKSPGPVGADVLHRSVRDGGPGHPFALFALPTARIASLLVTLALLVVLGIGRAKVGHRLLVTTAQTAGIAAAAALAGVGTGKLIS